MPGKVDPSNADPSKWVQRFRDCVGEKLGQWDTQTNPESIKKAANKISQHKKLHESDPDRVRLDSKRIAKPSDEIEKLAKRIQASGLPGNQ